jgi:hypothetical protein
MGRAGFGPADSVIPRMESRSWSAWNVCGFCLARSSAASVGVYDEMT